MRNLAEWIAVLASSDACVLITGERGSGKELVAWTIHARGSRREAPFVVLDGSVLADRTVSKDGAPCDAWLRGAGNGTLVLDGIEQLSLTAQAHLVRAIDAAWAGPRRGEHPQARGVRFITLSRDATPDRLLAAHLLESLRYRLLGVRLHVPPLRERGEDLPSLVEQLLRELAPAGGELPSLSPAAGAALSRYPYPGNVRELRRILEHAVAKAEGGPIDVTHLPKEVVGKR
jgi:DNA-binding NtrC family response regulator